MKIADIVLTQAVLEMIEEQHDKLRHRSEAAVDYLRERVGFYEQRCSDSNDQNNGDLTVSEIVELHDLVAHYHNALDLNDASPKHQHYIAYVAQVRDRLEQLRAAGEAL